MPGRIELQGVMDSLSDTLRQRFDPSGSLEVSERWLGLTALFASLMRRHGDWLALPDPHAPCDEVSTRLGHATAHLAAARQDAEKLAALDLIETALRDVEQLLDEAAGRDQPDIG